MAYSIEYTDDAVRDRANCIEYFLYVVDNGVGNPLIAKKFLKELEEVEKFLSSNAESCALLEEETLRTKGYRKIHLKHYKYKVVYRVEENKAIILAIIHDLRDYEKLLK